MNILLIDSKVNDYQVIVNACNTNTLAIVYSYNFTRDEISKCFSYISQKINRIGIFADQKAELFLDNEPFFVENENTLMLSDNTSFMIQLINDYDISYIDYFACNSLNDPNWVNYYEILMSLTNVIVGASNNATGNIQYGGDWIMENTCQDIESIYFSKNIEYYRYLLGYVTNFFVRTSSGNKDITNLFKDVGTSVGGGRDGKLITNNYSSINYGSGFRYKADPGTNIYSDMIHKLDVASTLLAPTNDQLTGYHIKYPAGSTTYKDLAYFINPVPVTLITTSPTVSPSNGLYYFSESNVITCVTSCTAYILLYGSGGRGAIGSGGWGDGGGGGGGEAVYCQVGLTQGNSYTLTIASHNTSQSVMKYSSFTYGTTINIKAMSGFAGQVVGALLSGGSGGSGGNSGTSGTSLTTTGGTSPYYQPGSNGGNYRVVSSDGIDLLSNSMNQTLYSKILTYTGATGITSGKGGGGSVAPASYSDPTGGRGGEGFPNCKFVTTTNNGYFLRIGGIACGGGGGGGDGGKGYAYIYVV